MNRVVSPAAGGGVADPRDVSNGHRPFRNERTRDHAQAGDPRPAACQAARALGHALAGQRCGHTSPHRTERGWNAVSSPQDEDRNHKVTYFHGFVILCCFLHFYFCDVKPALF